MANHSEILASVIDMKPEMTMFSPDETRELLGATPRNQQSDTLASVAGTNPDEMAEILKLSRKFNVPMLDVAQNLEAYRKGIVEPDWNDILARAPKTASFLTNPINMAINQAPERVRHLSMLETYLNPVPNFIENSKQFYIDMVNSIRMFGEASRFNQIAGTSDLAQFSPPVKAPSTPGEDYLFGSATSDVQMFDPTKGYQDKTLRAAVQTEWLKPTKIILSPNAPGGEYVQDVYGAAPQILSQYVLSMLTGGLGTVGRVAIGTGFMGLQIAGGTYGNLEAQGIDPDRAFRAGIANAALQAPLEAITFDGIAKGWLTKWVAAKLPAQAGKAMVVEKLIIGGLTEQVTEFIQKYPEAATEIWAKHGDLSPREQFGKFMDDFWETTKQGLYEGLVAMPYGLLGAGARIHLDRTRERYLQEYNQRIENAIVEAQKQDLIGKTPETVQDFINHVTDGEVLFVEPAALNRLFQVDEFAPEQLEQMLGVTREEINEAIQINEMVGVPLANYTTAAAQHETVKRMLQNHIAPEATEGLTQERINEKNRFTIERAKTVNATIETETKAEVVKIVESIIKAGKNTDVNGEAAKRAGVILEKHARVQWLNGLTPSPAQWLRENAPVYVKGIAPVQPANLRRQSYKGSIHWQDGRAVISLFEKADPSTLIHETVGHYFMESLIQEGAKTSVPDWMQKDRQTVLEYVGIIDWNGATDEQKHDAHEKMARSAEAYFMTGKAPSLGTRTMFRRFRDWLLSIYRDISALNANITPEVSSVLDRMIASQSEIEEMKRLEAYHERLPATILDTLSPALRDRYDRAIVNARAEAEDILQGRTLDYLTSNAKQARDAERNQAATDMDLEVSMDPFYRLTTQVETDFKADPKTTAKRYQDSALPMDQEYHFDVMARDHGYASGMHLAAEILDRPSREQQIKAKVEIHMKEWSDIFLDKGALKDAAREAMYNDSGRELLAIEQQILYEKLGRSIQAEQNRIEALAAAEKARLDAKDILSRRSIEDALRLQHFIAAESDAKAKAARYLAKGDVAEALDWKRRQLLAHAMVQESLNIRNEFSRLHRYLRRQASSKQDTWKSDELGKDNLRTVTMRHFHQAADILIRFGYRRKDYMPGMKEESLAAYVQRMTDENPAMIAVAEWLYLSDKTVPNSRKLTIDELREIVGAIRNIKTMSRAGVNADGFVAIHGDDFTGVSSAVFHAISAADKNAKDIQQDKLGGSVDNVGVVTNLPLVGPFIGGMQALLKKPAQLLLHLDGYKDFGIWDRLLYHHINQAQNMKSRLVDQVISAIETAYNSEGVTMADRHRDAHFEIYVKEWGTTVTKNVLRAIALNMGSASNTERLFSRAPVGLPGNIKWNEESVRRVLAVHLTEADLRLTQKLWNAVNLLYEPYNAMVRQMTGSELAKVEARPVQFTLANGAVVNLAGGYYPLSQDPRDSIIAEIREDQKASEGFIGVMPYPNAGASKARAKTASYAVDLRLDMLNTHVVDVAHDIAFRPVMHDITKVMRQNIIKETMRRKLGDANYLNFEKWRKIVARGRDAAADNSGGMNRAANWIRQSVVISSLLGRPGTVLQNAANPTLYGNAVREFNDKAAFGSYLTFGWMGTADYPAYIPNALAGTQAAEDLRQFVYAKSAMMRDKMENPDFSLRELHGTLKFETPLMRYNATQDTGIKLAVTHEKVIEFSSRILAFSDQLTDIPMWIGAYHQAIETGKNETDAVRMADTVIERTTGTGRTIDTSALQRGTPTERLFSMFMTFLNGQYNRWAQEYNIFLREKDMMRLISFAATKYLMFGFISALASFKLPKEDEDHWKWFVKEVLAWPASMFPVFGSMFKVALDNALGYKTYGFKLSPAERGLEDIIKLVMGASNENKSLHENAELSMQVAAFLFRYPDQINDWLNNGYDIMTGEMEFKGTDMIRRRPKSDR